MSTEKRVHLIIKGRVQGVGFRFFTMDKANEFAIVGWVRNTFRDEVEIVAEGKKEVLEHWIQILQKGPSHANVRHIEIKWFDATGQFSKFSIAATN
jgi:acylphosphatase